MARIDDYKKAAELGKSNLTEKNIDGIKAISVLILKMMRGQRGSDSGLFE